MYKLIKRVLRMAGDLKPRILLGFVFGFLEALFNVFPLIAIFYAFESCRDGLAGGELAVVIILLLAGLTGRVVFRYLVARFQSGAGFEMTAKERLRLGNILKNAPMSFFDSHEQGDLAACLTTDLSFVEMYVMFILDKVVNGFLMTAVTGIFLFVFDWRIALAAAAALVPSVLMFVFLQKSGKTLGSLRQNTQAELGAAVLEYAQGIMTAKAYGMKGKRAGRIKDAFHNSSEHSYRVERGFVRGVSAFQVLVRLAGCAMVLAVSFAALFGELELSSYFMLLVASMTMFSGFEQSVSKIPMLRIMEASLDRLERIVHLPQEELQREVPTPERFDISFEGVSFSYGKGQVLKNLSFHIPEHSTAALVGRSGSGKSTVMKLIPRFYDCGGGSVRIGNVDIRNMPRSQVFSYISMVFQNVYLFEDTIANNIRFGKPEASMEDVIEAARKARCYDFIMKMEKGFDTMVGEGGHTLSGGQKQRISIARAILKDAPIILLDEATSSVDPENEQQIQQAINQLVKNKTVVVIAHNLSAIRTVDKVLVLDEGRLLEEGDHSSLLQKKGLYSELWGMSEKVSLWEAT